MLKAKTHRLSELEAMRDEKILKDASNGDIKALVKFVSKGVDVTVVHDTKGVSTLHQAARSGNDRLVKFLVDENAMLDSRDNAGTTPLHIAAKNGHRRVAKVLIDGGAALDSKDKFGTTPLHVAAKNGYEEVIEVLVNAGAMVDTEDMYGWTPLSSALLKDYSSVVRYLINIGKADRSKVKYQFQNRIAALIGSVETAGDSTQQPQSKSDVDKEPEQSPTGLHVHSDNTQQQSLAESYDHKVQQQLTSCVMETDEGGQVQIKEVKEQCTFIVELQMPKEPHTDKTEQLLTEALETRQPTKRPKTKQFPKPESHNERHDPRRKESLNCEQIPATGPKMVMIVDDDNNESISPRIPGAYRRQQLLERTGEDSVGETQLRQPSVELGDDQLPKGREPDNTTTKDENKPPQNCKRNKAKRRWHRFW